MAMRGSLYRCHLCSFLFGDSGPQTEGVEATWCQKLEPVGDRALLSGEPVEICITIENSTVPITLDTPIRIDILEEDVVNDDVVGSLCCGTALPKDPEFKLLDYRAIHVEPMLEYEEVEEAVARFQSAFVEDYRDYLLVLRDPVNYETYYLVAWWTAVHQKESGDAEFYFIVNIADAMEEKSDPVLNVKAEETKSAPVAGEAAIVQSLAAKPRFSAALRFALAASRDNQVPTDDESMSADVPPPANDPAFRSAIELYANRYPLLFPRTVESDEELFAVDTPRPRPARLSLWAPNAAPDAAPTSTTPAQEEWRWGPHPNEPASSDQIPKGRSPLDARIIFIARPSSVFGGNVYIATSDVSIHYVACYRLSRALVLGMTLFGPGGFAILEGPLQLPGVVPPPEKRTRYLVIALEERIKESEIKVERDQKGSRYLGAQNVSPFHVDGPDLYIWRVISLPSAVDSPYGATGVLSSSLLEREWDKQRKGELQDDRKAVTLDNTLVADRLNATVLKDIDDAIAAGNKELAVQRMSVLTYRAFTEIDADKRRRYIVTVVARVGLFLQDDEANRALLELFRSFSIKTGLTEILALKGEDDQHVTDGDFDKIVRTVREELMDILYEVGLRWPAEELKKVDAGYFFGLVLDGAAPSPPLAVKLILTVLTLGLSSWSVSKRDATELANELLEAARTMVDFLKDLLGGILQIVVHPVDFLSSLVSLVELIVKLMLAGPDLPQQLTVKGLAHYCAQLIGLTRNVQISTGLVIDAEAEIEALIRENASPRMIAALEQQGAIVQVLFWDFLIGAQQQARAEIRALVDHIKERVSRVAIGIKQLDMGRRVARHYEWRLLWEIASLFVGAGEVKAVFSAISGGGRAAALLAAKLAGKAELVADAEKVAQFIERSGELSKGTHAAEIVGHLPENKAAEAADVAKSVKQVETAKTYPQLRNANPDAAAQVDKMRDLGTRARATDVFRSKLGGVIPDIAEEAIGLLEKEAAFTEDELLKLMATMPESNAPAFARAVARLGNGQKLGLSAGAMKELYAYLARNPRLAALLSRGEEYPRIFAAIQASKGSLAESERLLARMSEVIGNDSSRAATLLQDALAGDIAKVEKTLEETAATSAVNARIAAIKEPARSAATSAALDFLRTKAAFTDAELARMLESLTEERLQKLVDALQNLQKAEGELGTFAWLDQPDMLRKFLKQLARAPRCADRIAAGGKDLSLFKTLFNSTWGSTAETERMLAALERETANLNKAGKASDAARLASDAAAGKTLELERLAEQLAPAERKLTQAQIEQRWAEAKELPQWEQVLERRARLAEQPQPTPARWHMRDILRDGESAYLEIKEPARSALDTIATRYENQFRDLITELDPRRYQTLRAALAQDISESRALQSLGETALSEIDKINESRVNAVREAIGDVVRDADGALLREGKNLVAPAASEVAAGIAEKITLDGFEKALESKRQSILRRLREYEDIAVSAPTARRRTSARRYVRTLERQLDKLSLWRNAENLAERERVLAQLRESVQNNLKLRDLLHHGGGPMLMESAADLAFGQSLRGPASLAKTPLKTVVADFMDYFSNRISHFRGNSGEWDLAYDLGKKGHVVLKCGDEFVSRRGTDLVTMFREADGRWRMMIFDNKAIRDATVTEVSALVDNLLTNLKSDQKLFAAMARRPGAQPEFAEAARRLQVVTAEIDLIMKSHGGKMTHLAQSEIAFALAKQDVQLIVSNAGGQAKGLSQSLRTMMDFYPSPGGVLPTAIPVPTTVP